MIDTATKVVCSCPINGQRCVDGEREDFDKDANGRVIKCRWWQHLYGKDPQTEKTIDQWDCAIAWLPITGIEGAQMSRQTAASVDKVANEIVSTKMDIANLGRAIQVAAASIKQGIEQGALNVLIGPPNQEPPANGSNGHG